MQIIATMRDTFLCPRYRPLNPLPTRDRRRNLAVSAAAAGTRQRRQQNVEGEFFVDHRCIDCDTCRWMAPQIFTRMDEQSAVIKQPSCEEERIKALQALLSCPTSSIHTEKPPKEIVEVQKTFPLPIDDKKLPEIKKFGSTLLKKLLKDNFSDDIDVIIKGIYHCGYHSDRSYGGTSYLIVHPEGNILVDSPRYTEVLARNIEMLGGASYMFLTHKDDVGDHEEWSKRLRCQRILHSGDVEVTTADVEMQLQGNGPWSIGTEFELIHTPGHTEGSVCLYYKPLKVLFTGDHLAKSEDSELSINEKYNRQSVSMQLNNVRKFLDFDFKWILPGHGRRVEFEDNREKNSALEAFLATKEQAHV